VLDPSNLIVYAPSRQTAYHVQISPPASGLRWVDSLAFVGRSSRICGYAGEQLLIPAGRGTERFSIVGVSRLDQAGLDALLTAAGRPAGAGAEPEPAAGDEINRDLEQEER
jgi:hypothetical protein